MNNVFFRKTTKNVRKHRDIKLVASDRRGICLVSKRNYQSTKLFKENLLKAEMKKKQILISKTVYKKFSIQELSKILVCEFWYDCIKPKYGEKTYGFYMDTDRLIVYIDTQRIFIKTLRMLRIDLILKTMN